MSKLNMIFEALQNKIDAGEITVETANQVLDKAKAKYPGEEVGELTEAAPLTLEDAIDGINAILNEAEELHKEQGTATTSSDEPDLPEKTSTGEGVTNAIDANDESSTKKMEDLAKNNDENAKADAQGEEGKDTTVCADDVTESVVNSVNNLKLRVYEAAAAGYISDADKVNFLDLLDLSKYTFEKSEDDEDEEEEDEKKDDEKEDEDEDKKDKKKKKDDEEECDHEDKDGDGECDKCGADMDEEETKEESAYTKKILDAYTEGVISEDQVIFLLSK